MWAELWADFDERAVALIGGQQPNDPIDWTIQWQIDGTTPHVAAAIAPANLQLPELYSGRPWDYGAQWIAFVTVNPSINPLEIFPTRAHLPPAPRGSDAIQHLIKFFEERFDPGPILHHGRNGANPAAWLSQHIPAPEFQHTWAAIENALRACLNAHQIPAGPAPLGQKAAIVDVVPWKFAAWGQAAPAIRNGLLASGAPYFHATLHQHPPAFIVAAGQDARIAMHQLFPALPAYVPNQHVAVGALEINGAIVPWRGLPHPTAHGNIFGRAMELISPDLAAVLAP